ncbi:class II aldolase/adducin family protein [Roseobacteraceae bacterium S113]
MTRPELLTPEFRALSARLGSDPLQVQGPGGNTSIKEGGIMWIKASGTELADAERNNIFVAVDRNAAVEEARERAGDGSCKTTVLDPAITLRPSIETTFHAALDWAVVAHTHSVATLTHVISPEGRTVAESKLAGLPFVMVPYAKPGLPLTREILARVTSQTQVILLQNHGLICCGPDVDAVSRLIAEVETRLAMPAAETARPVAADAAPDGFVWSDYGWLAAHHRATELATQGTYYPDHVVFLGPALPQADHAAAPPPSFALTKACCCVLAPRPRRWPCCAVSRTCLRACPTIGAPSRLGLRPKPNCWTGTPRNTARRWRRAADVHAWDRHRHIGRPHRRVARRRGHLKRARAASGPGQRRHRRDAVVGRGRCLPACANAEFARRGARAP